MNQRTVFHREQSFINDIDPNGPQCLPVKPVVEKRYFDFTVDGLPMEFLEQIPQSSQNWWSLGDLRSSDFKIVKNELRKKVKNNKTFSFLLLFILLLILILL